MSRNSGRDSMVSRRKLLRYSTLLGLSAAVSSLVPVPEAEAFLFGRKKEQKIFKTKLVMGTYVSITAIHSSKDQAEEAIELAFAEIDRLAALLSRHLESSPLSYLNRYGSLKDAPQELVEVLTQALKYNRSSSGAFDITVLPLLDLYDERFAAGNIPEENEIEERLELVGSEHIHLNGNHISLVRTGMRLTTDGIAKGYIVDRASRVLIERGIDNHLINGGGDIRTHGNGAKGKPWAIAVQDPAKDRHYPEILHLNTGAVATSGNYEIYYDKAKLFHHIIDPATGRSPLLSKSVTTIAPTVTDADALSTTVFVQGPADGIQYINTQAGTSCLIIDKDGVIHRSRKWS